MIKIAKAPTISLGALLLPLFFLLAQTPVYAQDPKKITDIVNILGNIIKLLAPAAGIAFFIMLLVGGFQLVTSGGDPKAAGQARTTLTYAVIGIILVVVSWLILLLIKNLTGVDVTEVKLDLPNVFTPSPTPSPEVGPPPPPWVI